MFFPPTESSRKIYQEPGFFSRIFSIESFLIVIIFVLLGVLLNVAIEALTTKQKFLSNNSGITISKEHQEAYSSTTLMSTGKSLIPITQHHPEKFILLVKTNERTCAISVPEKIFKETENGDKVSLKIYQKSYMNLLFQKTTTEECSISD